MGLSLHCDRQYEKKNFRGAYCFLLALRSLSLDPLLGQNWSFQFKLPMEKYYARVQTIRIRIEIEIIGYQNMIILFY